MGKLRAEKTRLQAGMVAIDPTTGDVKAWVGSSDFDTDQYDHVGRAQRQPGSTFKPFVYGAALEQGMRPDRQFVDKVQDIPMPDGTVWRPEDVGTPSGRPTSMRDGLVYSKNTITAQVMSQVGPARAADFARRAGVRQSKLKPVPSLALGTSPVTLLEMTAAYGTIASGGLHRAPMMVTRVEDRNGRVLVEFTLRGDRVLSRGTAEELTDMMRGAIDQGTGQAIRSQFGIRSDVAGKTGTTQDNTDGWFILMHPRLVAGAWVGFNDARVTMRSDYWGQGGHNALLLVGDFFRQASTRRMIDTAAVFPRARDGLPGAAIWGPPLDWLRGLIGDDPAPRKAAPANNVSSLEKMEQLIRDAFETGEAVQREWRRLAATFSTGFYNFSVNFVSAFHDENYLNEIFDVAMASKPVIFTKKLLCKFWRHVSAFLQHAGHIHQFFARFPGLCVELIIRFPRGKTLFPHGYELSQVCNGQCSGVLTAGTCASPCDERSYYL